MSTSVLEVLIKPPWEACTALTFPQAWQWCRLKVRVKSEPQFMHIMTWDTGTSVGGLSPKGIPSLSLSLKSKKNKWRSIHTYKVHLVNPVPLHTILSFQSTFTCKDPQIFSFLMHLYKWHTAASALEDWYTLLLESQKAQIHINLFLVRPWHSFPSDKYVTNCIWKLLVGTWIKSIFLLPAFEITSIKSSTTFNL